MSLDHTRALQGNTGHAQVRIRAGIHIGPMRVEAGDGFGAPRSDVGPFTRSCGLTVQSFVESDLAVRAASL